MDRFNDNDGEDGIDEYDFICNEEGENPEQVPTLIIPNSFIYFALFCIADYYSANDSSDCHEFVETYFNTKIDPYMSNNKIIDGISKHNMSSLFVSFIRHLHPDLNDDLFKSKSLQNDQRLLDFLFHIHDRNPYWKEYLYNNIESWNLFSFSRLEKINIDICLEIIKLFKESRNLPDERIVFMNCSSQINVTPPKGIDIELYKYQFTCALVSKIFIVDGKSIAIPCLILASPPDIFILSNNYTSFIYYENGNDSFERAFAHTKIYFVFYSRLSEFDPVVKHYESSLYQNIVYQKDIVPFIDFVTKNKLKEWESVEQINYFDLFIEYLQFPSLFISDCNVGKSDHIFSTEICEAIQSRILYGYDSNLISQSNNSVDGNAMYNSVLIYSRFTKWLYKVMSIIDLINENKSFETVFAELFSIIPIENKYLYYFTLKLLGLFFDSKEIQHSQNFSDYCQLLQYVTGEKYDELFPSFKKVSVLSPINIIMHSPIIKEDPLRIDNFVTIYSEKWKIFIEKYPQFSDLDAKKILEYECCPNDSYSTRVKLYSESQAIVV